MPSIAYSSTYDAIHMAVLWGAVALGAIYTRAKGYEKYDVFFGPLSYVSRYLDLANAAISCASMYQHILYVRAHMILGIIYFVVGCPQVAAKNFALGGNMFYRIDEDCEDLETFIKHSDLTKRLVLFLHRI